MNWTAPLTVPPMSESSLQVWRLDVRETPSWCDASSLSPAEQQRASRMRVPLAREEFVAARRLLRTLLGSNVGITPSELIFAENRNGKPCLAAGSTVDFNVSHSHGLILVALSRVGRVGVDLEYCDDSPRSPGEWIALARTAFQPAEVQVIERAPDGPRRRQAFYRAWTRREAVAKADGRGIAGSPVYQVTEREGEFDRVLLEDTTYFVRHLDVSRYYAAAVATLRSDPPVTLHDAANLRG